MPATLDSYHQKRHFEHTGEPQGAVTRRRQRRLAFVVQHHLASHDHYDLRLEWDGVLKSWAVPKGPSYDSHQKRLAVQVEDHPLAYRHFEGTIPKGQYGGGTVMIWDEGTWHPLEDATRGLAEGALKFELHGNRLKGRWTLVRMKPRAGEKDNNWLLIKEKDALENLFDVSRFVTSASTGRTMAQIAAHAGGQAEDEPAAKQAGGTAAKKAKAKKTAPKAKAAPKAEPVAKAAVGAKPTPPARLTHPEKLLYPQDGITKGQVADYYRAVAPRMLPHVAGRVLSAVRCPNGIGSACFYRKHPGSSLPGVATVMVPPGSGTGQAEEYIAITGEDGLLAEVQMNTIEFHPWASRAEALEQPDVMVFDLDPDEGMPLATIRRGVRDLKDMLDQLGLTAYLKTSGGKGYHVVVPFCPVAGWQAFRAFAQNIAKTMQALWPQRYTSNERKAQRKGRIFIDWMRNGRGATSVAPYSLRARAGAPVSMPIAWAELDTVAPAGITMAKALRRLQEEDPWAGFFAGGQQLKEAP